jgi:hypothetical protein
MNKVVEAFSVHSRLVLPMPDRPKMQPLMPFALREPFVGADDGRAIRLLPLQAAAAARSDPMAACFASKIVEALQRVDARPRAAELSRSAATIAKAMSSTVASSTGSGSLAGSSWPGMLREN